MLALGIVILIKKNNILFWVIIALGAFLIIDAVIRLIQFLMLPKEEKKVNVDILRAVVETVLGIVAVLNSNSVVMFLFIFLGVVIVVEGMLHIQFVLTHKKQIEHWLINFFAAIFYTLLGIFVIVHPLLMNEAVHIYIGIEIIISSVIGLCSYIYLFAVLRNTTDIIESEIIEEVE